MEQNLSEKERKQRLASGIGFEVAALILYFIGADQVLTLVFAFIGIGFIFNYFTCFCGTKKLISSLKSKI